MPASGSSRTRACALLLGAVALFAVTAVQAQGNCPNLFLGPPSKLLSDLVQDCAGTAGCAACQCSLVRVFTPQLVRSGKILASEAWMGSSMATISETLTRCKKEFAVQLLENSQLSLSQLSGLDTCPSDVKAVSQCASSRQPTAAAANTTAGRAAAPGAPPSMWDEVLAEGCAASLAASGAASNTSCPSPAAARMTAGLRPAALVASSSSSGDGAPSVLAITAANTRGATTWRAGCWCDETYDPVCDPVTRKQYPSACSAKCQMVVQPVACEALEPLVNQTRAGSTAVYVLDQSLLQAAGKAPRTAAAFDGPTPPEPSRDTQLFYYYYEDDADDTQEALEIASTVVEAIMAASFGSQSSAADSLATSLPPAIKAGADANSANVTKADGPANNATGPLGGDLLAELWGMRNITLVRQRLQRGSSRAQPAAERRNVSVPLPTAAPGSPPGAPEWLHTNAPGQVAGVYHRDAQRTSRILASLMAAAVEARNRTQAAKLVVNLGQGLNNVVQAAAGAAQLGDLQPFGGLFGSPAEASLPQVLATSRSASIHNATAANTTRTNVTATNTTSLRAAGPAVKALEGLADSLGVSTRARATTARGGFKAILDELTKLRKPEASTTANSPIVQALQGRMGAMRSGILTNATLAGNTTGNATRATAAVQKKQAPKRLRRFRLFF